VSIAPNRQREHTSRAASGVGADGASRLTRTDLRRAAMRRRRRRRLFPLVGGLVVLLLILTPVLGAASTPGNEDFKAKLADWLRGHHAAALVTPIESWYYSSHAPKKGGQLRSLNALPPGASSKAGPGAPAHVGLPAPADVPLVVQPGLPGEGVWQPVGPSVAGSPAMYEAQFRADQVYTSQVTSAVWFDPTRLKLSLIPGLTEPGGSWPEPPYLSGAAEQAAVAAFNGGFRFQDAHGGFYLDGKEAVPLQNGAASIVLYNDGKVNIGTWGTEVTMTPDVHAVLQNLVPIVDNGQTAPSAVYGDSAIWGATLGASTVVPRSGVGITANGGMVYVAGPALTAKSLAESLQRAGAVRAMALDLNPEWVTFNYFTHNADGTTTGTKLYPQQQRPADRYLGPTEESRDFFVISTPS
jgi:hypothetical protein